MSSWFLLLPLPSQIWASFLCLVQNQVSGLPLHRSGFSQRDRPGRRYIVGGYCKDLTYEMAVAS